VDNLCNSSIAKRRQDETMTPKDRAIFTSDPHDLDVEELEERLELASLFATNASGTTGEQAVAIDWGNCSPSGPYVC